MTNSLVTPMFYNQKGEKLNLETWMSGIEKQQSDLDKELTQKYSDFETELESENEEFQDTLNGTVNEKIGTLTTTVNNRIDTLVTLNGAANASPSFWAPTTAPGYGKLPYYNGGMGWISPDELHLEYYRYNASTSYANSFRLQLPKDNVYVIFIYVTISNIGHLGVGIARVGTEIPNAPIVVEGKEFTISVYNYNTEKKEVVILGPDGTSLQKCAWLKLA